VKLTVQVQLKPIAPEQDGSLLRTLETVNQACNWLSECAWAEKEFRQFPLHRAFYKSIREKFPLTAQMVVRLIAKVADAYKVDERRLRTFRKHGSIAYDDRILSWNMAESRVSISSLDGRLSIPFVCGDRQRELLAFQRGESDLVYRDRKWFLFTTVDIPDTKEQEAIDWIGVDLGIVAIAQTSDGKCHAGGHLNGLRLRHRRLRRKLQAKRTRAAKRLLRKRRLREKRFAAAVNHKISKEIVTVAERTGRAIALEDLKGIRSRARARKPQRSRLHSWAFDQLQSFVVYKAKRAGVPVQFVDPRNTSRRCAACGHIDERNRKSQSVFCCTSCNHRTNADANAAKNIRWAAVNRPNLTGVDALGVHSHVAKRSLVKSYLL
jgi:IS605 OrfB family transposase